MDLSPFPTLLTPDEKPFDQFKCTHVYVVTARTDTMITMINPLGKVVEVRFATGKANNATGVLVPYANNWFDKLVSGITVGPGGNF